MKPIGPFICPMCERKTNRVPSNTPGREFFYCPLCNRTHEVKAK
jgi:hypothetical protein